MIPPEYDVEEEEKAGPLRDQVLRREPWEAAAAPSIDVEVALPAVHACAVPVHVCAVEDMPVRSARTKDHRECSHSHYGESRHFRY